MVGSAPFLLSMALAWSAAFWQRSTAPDSHDLTVAGGPSYPPACDGEPMSQPRPPRPPGSTAARGYGRSHQLHRAKLAPPFAAGLMRCSACGRRIQPHQEWDLAHASVHGAHRAGIYAGPQHARTADCPAGGNRATNTRRPRVSQPSPPALAFFDTRGSKRL